MAGEEQYGISKNTLVTKYLLYLYTLKNMIWHLFRPLVMYQFISSVNVPVYQQCDIATI